MASQGTLNKVMLIGHTGDNVKMHYFDNGGCIGRVPLATNESYVNRTTGEQVTNTEWHNIVLRNKGAEVCEKYLKKGDKVYIEGRIKTRKWQDDKGVDRYTTEIQALNFTFLTPKNQGGNDGSSTPTGQSYDASSQASQSSQNNNGQKSAAPNVEEEEDDLPF